MGTVLSVIVYVLLASVLLAGIYALKAARLKQRFDKLGNPQGRSLAEILDRVGPPSHRGQRGDHEVLEWRRVNFHIALSFSNGVCDGIYRTSQN